MRNIIIPLLLVCILMSGCINSGSQSNTPQESDSQLIQNESHPGRSFNGSIGNRSEWNMDNRSRGMWNMTQMGGGERNWSANMSDRFFELRKRLNLSDNASEEELRDALIKMREDRGMQPSGNPPKNPPNNLN